MAQSYLARCEQRYSTDHPHIPCSFHVAKIAQRLGRPEQGLTRPYRRRRENIPLARWEVDNGGNTGRVSQERVLCDGIGGKMLR
jgi:hypothetical protein